ncbi:MAG: response regulator [Nitrospinae bacterium]|nr:response regulator [Nitrospinota bacterium]
MEEKRIFLLPGEFHVSKEPYLIATLLGSCVAVCLFDRKQGFGGMNHYMLPTQPAGTKGDAKYGDFSIRTMVNIMSRNDPSMRNLQSMVFGGAAVTESLTSSSNIGEKNIEIAKRVLEEFKIPIIREETGGTSGRKLHYKTWTNDIQVRAIQKSEQTHHFSEKEKYFSKYKIKVLVVDDSSLIQQIIKTALDGHPDIEVVGTASDAFEAREKILELEPDVVTLDIIMPKMDGIKFLKKLMLHYPLPVIIISSIAQKGSAVRTRAGEIGAVDVIDKEELALYSDPGKLQGILTDKIKAAAKILVKKKTASEVGDA